MEISTVTNKSDAKKQEMQVYDGRSYQPLPRLFFALFVKDSQTNRTLRSEYAMASLAPDRDQMRVQQLFGTIGNEHWMATVEPVSKADKRLVVMRPISRHEWAQVA